MAANAAAAPATPKSAIIHGIAIAHIAPVDNELLLDSTNSVLFVLEVVIVVNLDVVPEAIIVVNLDVVTLDVIIEVAPDDVVDVPSVVVVLSVAVASSVSISV